MFVARVLCDMLRFSEFIEKYVVSGGTQTRIFPSSPIPKVELDSFFFIQTGPNTPLYANSSLTRAYFFSPLLPFSFVGLRGRATKKKLVLQLYGDCLLYTSDAADE